MVNLKSEQHHWWPKCVSQYWKNADGKVNWLSPSGEVRPIPPERVGRIGNGHHIKLHRDPDQSSVWDQSFEKEFDRADSNFIKVIDWLNSLHREDLYGAPLRHRFVEQRASEEMLGLLVECTVSLAVRGPLHRFLAARPAEYLWGQLPRRERNTIIGLNMRNSQRRVVEAIGTRGKFVAIFSPKREFVFGDGFCHNITQQSAYTFGQKILAPLTPELSVLYVCPQRYTVEPKLTTIIVTPEEADVLNQVVQVYACDALYYRSEAPLIIDAFRQRQHLCFSDHDNSVDLLIDHIPGVYPGDGSLNFLGKMFSDSGM